MSQTKRALDFCEDHDIDVSFDSFLAEAEGRKKTPFEFIRDTDNMIFESIIGLKK